MGSGTNNGKQPPKICGGTFGFGGIEGDAALGGAFAGGIVEADSVNGVSAGSLVEGWLGGEIAAGGVGKITSKSSSSVLKGWFGFFGASISAGPLAGLQVGVASGGGWSGLYVVGHVGPVALGSGGYLRSSCKAGG